MNYKYSIIIPHFNIPKLLQRCLWSIPNRDDTQVIVVDDRSSDENIVLLRELERIYSNVEFIYSETNGGGGKARNTGLQHATGEYVLFADADDYFNYCIRDIFDDYINESCDIIFFNANYVNTETYLPTKRGPSLKWVMREYERTKNSDLLRYMFGEPWCKLVRRDLIECNNVRFDETPIHNDTFFSYMVGYYARNVKVDMRALYCLADRGGSVSKAMSDEMLMVRTRVFGVKNRFLSDHNIDMFDNLMLQPLLVYLRRFDKFHLKQYFSITSEYNFSKVFIFKRYVKWEFSMKKRGLSIRLINLLGEG